MPTPQLHHLHHDYDHDAWCRGKSRPVQAWLTPHTRRLLSSASECLHPICSDSYTSLSRFVVDRQYRHSQLEQPVVCSFAGRFSHSHAFPDSPRPRPRRRCLRTAQAPQSPTRLPSPTARATSMVSQNRGHSVNPILTPSPSPTPVRSSQLFDVLPSTHHSPRLNPPLFLEDLVTHIVGLERNLGIHNPWT